MVYKKGKWNVIQFIILDLNEAMIQGIEVKIRSIILQNRNRSDFFRDLSHWYLFPPIFKTRQITLNKGKTIAIQDVTLNPVVLAIH